MSETNNTKLLTHEEIKNSIVQNCGLKPDEAKTFFEGKSEEEVEKIYTSINQVQSNIIKPYLRYDDMNSFLSMKGIEFLEKNGLKLDNGKTVKYGYYGDIPENFIEANKEKILKAIFIENKTQIIVALEESGGEYQDTDYVVFRVE